MSDFAKNLKRIRVSKGLSQVDLAKQLCISNNSIVRYEKGSVEPRLTMLLAMADALDCSVNDLCGQNTEVNPKLEAIIAQLSSLNEADLEFVSSFISRL